jgi:subtilisin-like proprotein convertase family protein
MWRKPRVTLLAILSVSLVSSSLAQNGLFGDRTVQEILAEKASRSPEEQKINSLVLQTLRALRLAGDSSGELGRSLENAGGTLQMDEDRRLRLYLYLDEGYVADDLELELEALGCDLEVFERRFHIVQVWVPYRAVGKIAALPPVRRIAFAETPYRRTGSKTSEGDAVMRADIARPLFAVDGTGLRVGAISDGVDSLSVAVASGDLPSNVQVIRTYQGSATQAEGTAMLEIIHDLAPGAGLAFSTAFPTSLVFIQSVRDLADPANGNCDIIVDDIIFFDEPVWEDGPIAQIVDSVVNIGGVAYFSSAGNEGEVTYVENYNSGGPLLPGLNDVHLFGPGDPAMRVSVAPGEVIIPTLHWNKPYGASSDDYDLFVYDAALQVILASSTDLQNGSGDPVERTSYKNLDNDELFINIVVNRASGSPSVELHLVNFGNGVTQHEYIRPVGGIYGHNSAPGAVAVGAIRSSAFGGGSFVAEDFSTYGPRQIEFPAPVLRNTPQIASIDGVSITGAGGFGQQVPPGSGNSFFFGTSASAPHAASVAALLLEADPTLTPAQVASVMAGTALDLGSPGWNSNIGHGRLDAFNVLASMGRAYLANPQLVVDAISPVVLDTIVISDTGSVSSVMLSFVCEHAYVGELIVELEAPGGQTVMVMQRPGPPPSGDDGNNPNILLDDNAPFAIDSIDFGPNEDVLGSYFPVPGMLNVLKGVPMNGSWVLKVTDTDPGFNDGKLYHWGLSFPLTTSLDDQPAGSIPSGYALHQNYPNPFNPETVVEYAVPEASSVTITVYNVLGEEVATLVSGEHPAGLFRASWDGSGVPSGVYFYRLQAGAVASGSGRYAIHTRKMLLLK